MNPGSPAWEAGVLDQARRPPPRFIAITAFYVFFSGRLHTTSGELFIRFSFSWWVECLKQLSATMFVC